MCFFSIQSQSDHLGHILMPGCRGGSVWYCNSFWHKHFKQELHFQVLAGLHKIFTMQNHNPIITGWHILYSCCYFPLMFLIVWESQRERAGEVDVQGCSCTNHQSVHCEEISHSTACKPLNPMLSKYTWRLTRDSSRTMKHSPTIFIWRTCDSSLMTHFSGTFSCPQAAPSQKYITQKRISLFFFSWHTALDRHIRLQIHIRLYLWATVLEDVSIFDSYWIV